MSGEIVSLLAVIVGALIALVATLLTETLRTRRERAAVLSQVRYDAYLAYLAAVVAANDALQALSSNEGPPQPAEVAAAMRATGLYTARERVLVTGAPEMVLAVETAFRGLLAMRDLVAQGASLVWPDYRPANDELARTFWALRQAARREFGTGMLDLDRLSAVRPPNLSERLHAPKTATADS